MVRVAERIARKKARHKCHRHAALILKNGNIVAAGWNHENIHAERDAIDKAIITMPIVDYNSQILKGCEILSIRVMRSGKLGMAKPCADCMAVIRNHGLKRLRYTDSNGQVITEKI